MLLTFSLLDYLRPFCYELVDLYTVFDEYIIDLFSNDCVHEYDFAV